MNMCYGVLNSKLITAKWFHERKPLLDCGFVCMYTMATAFIAKFHGLGFHISSTSFIGAFRLWNMVINNNIFHLIKSCLGVWLTFKNDRFCLKKSCALSKLFIPSNLQIKFHSVFDITKTKKLLLKYFLDSAII